MATVHVHNDIRYSVNAEGRCEWYNCTHNAYNSFDEPEMVEETSEESEPPEPEAKF